MSPAEHLSLPSLLVVEDEALLLMLVAESLRDSGFTVHEAGEAQSALSILQTHPDIGMMLTDIRMPGMNGFQLTEAAVTPAPISRNFASSPSSPACLICTSSSRIWKRVSSPWRRGRAAKSVVESYRRRRRTLAGVTAKLDGIGLHSGVATWVRMS